MSKKIRNSKEILQQMNFGDKPSLRQLGNTLRYWQANNDVCQGNIPFGNPN